MPGPEKASDVLKRLLKDSSLGHDLQHMEVYSIWREVAGAEGARHSRVVGVKANVLQVEVDSSPWLSEFALFRKESLLAELKAGLKKTRIVDIDFRIGKF